MKPCIHCGGPHAHYRCPKQEPYSETGAMIELGKLDYERTFSQAQPETYTDIEGEDFWLV